MTYLYLTEGTANGIDRSITNVWSRVRIGLKPCRVTGLLDGTTCLDILKTITHKGGGGGEMYKRHATYRMDGGASSHVETPIAIVLHNTTQERWSTMANNF